MDDWYRMLNAPTTRQYVRALRALEKRVTEKHRRLFAAHYRAPQKTAFPSKLVKLARLGGKAIVVNRAYGNLGRWVCEELGIRPELRPNGRFRWWSVLSDGRFVDKKFEWRMRPEFARALKQLRWVGSGKSDGIKASNAARSTFLLVWNPKQFHTWQDLAKEFPVTHEPHPGRWSSGQSKSIRPGDRLFLARVGAEPKGIVASGVATSTPYAAEHWRAELKRRGKKSRFIDLKFDAVLDPIREPILTLRDIKQARVGTFNWSPQASGVQIPQPIAARLERLWVSRTRTKRTPVLTVQAMAVEGALTEQTRYVRGRSRALRDKVLAASDGTCQACGVNYWQMFGGDGSRVLQVHHKRQLSVTDAPRLTKSSDLIVLCANCHCLIHMDPRKALTLEALRQFLRKGRGSEASVGRARRRGRRS